MLHRSLALIAPIALLLCLGESPAAQPAARPALLAVPLGEEYVQADRELARRLGAMLATDVRHDDNFNTAANLIERLLTTREPYFARMTPYALVAAEMLGARFEVLGTYESAATGTTTYRSYFVVNTRRFQEFPATLDGVYEYLKSRPRPARFIYHDKFSTSSYFLPALWFRSHRVFATEQPASSVVRVAPIKGDFTSSGESVDRVAADEAELAAVWDGTKLRHRENLAVQFIPLSTTLPNDLLVASMSIPEGTRAAIRRGLDAGGPIGIGDFRRWRSIDNAREALDALNALKRDARESPAPVVVRVNADIAGHDDRTAALLAAYADDARQAIRLAGTEFTLEEPKYHEAVDVIWTVRWVHEGTILLASEMQDVRQDVRDRLRQEFHLSFTPAEGDLARRIVSLIHSRMHRVRYVWPYQDMAPTVIRDVDFTIPVDVAVHVQRLTWRDPDRNDFVAAGAFDATPLEITPATFAFDRRDFVPADGGALDFQNPLSDVTYRVVLERQSHESTLSKVLTGTFLGLLLLTGLGAAGDVRRRMRPVRPPDPHNLPEICAAMAGGIVDPWRGRVLKDADVICCARPRIEEQIEELKSEGKVPAPMGGVTTLAYQVTAGGMVPFMKGLSAEISRRVDLVVDPSRVGDTRRLSALLDILIRRQLLSRFAGRPLEWDALNELIRKNLPEAAAGELIIRPEDETVVKMVSHHFSGVLDDGQKHLSLLRGAWMLSRRDSRCFAHQKIALPGAMEIGARRVSSMILEFNIAEDVELPLDAGTGVLNCWVLGKIVRPTIVDDDGLPALSLHLRTVALLFGDATAPGQLVTRRAGEIDSAIQAGV